MTPRTLPRTRDQMINHIQANLMHTTAASAVREGAVEWLGGFDKVFPTEGPGWILKAVSRFNKTWYVGVTPDGKFGVRVNLVPEVPWEHWAGGNNELYSGDRPEFYAKLRTIKKERM